MCGHKSQENLWFFHFYSSKKDTENSVSFCAFLISADLQSELLDLFFIRHFLNHTAEASELLIEALISSLDIHDIIHNGDAFRRKSGDAQRRSGS